MRVKVYRNLHKQCFSVVDKRTRRVAAHQLQVVLKDAWFSVSECARARVLREKRKNVHAYVHGELVRAQDVSFFAHAGREAYYNPYKVKTFVDKETNEPVDRAALVMLVPGRIYYWSYE